MGMGIVSDSDFNKELAKSSKDETNKVTGTTNGVVKVIEKGRGNGNNEVPNSLRKIIGEESVTNGRAGALAIAKQFGISESSVSAYANGATSTSSYDEKPNESHIEDAKVRVSKRARSKLMMALHNITPNKLNEAKVRDLAGIAKDMAVIIKTMEPDRPDDSNRGTASPTFVLYAPQFLKEETFETIDISSKE